MAKQKRAATLKTPKAQTPPKSATVTPETPAVVVPVTPTPAPLQVETAPAPMDRVAADSDLPQPEDVRIQESERAAAAVAPIGIQVEEIPDEVPLGVSEEEIDLDDEDGRLSEGPDPAQAFVQIRALVDVDGSPVVCGFNFETVVGKDARTGRPIRGKFCKGYLYNVPLFVAIHFMEKNWALRV